ncbi:MAG: NUDIX hydrolase [Halioglobus sp.]
MTTKRELSYCCFCGATLCTKILAGDSQPRAWCDSCKVAHYQNPTVLVAVFLHCGNKLLWAQRGIEPAKGKWAFPSGFMENGESMQQAAARELFEETRISLMPSLLVPMSISSVLPIDQVYMVFRCDCQDELTAEITEETTDWGWFERADAPWSEMAHPESKVLVEQVYDAIESRRFFMRVGQMGQDGNQHQRYSLGEGI